MVINVHKLSILILLLYVTAASAYTNDTLESWMAKFSKIGQVDYSANGRWVTARKSYEYSKDTLMVFDTKKAGAPIGFIVGIPGRTSFMKDDGLFISGGGKAEFWNLLSNKRISYKDINRATAITQQNRYCILDKQRNLLVKGSTGATLHQIENVLDFKTDNRSSLYVLRNNNGLYEVLDLSGDKAILIFSSEVACNKVDLSESGKHIIIRGRFDNSEKDRLLFIDTKTRSSTILHDIFLAPEEEIIIKDIQNGRGYHIKTQSYEKDNEMVEIWYGNDGAIENTESGTETIARHWVWISKSNEVKQLPNQELKSVFGIGSTRYFLNFNRKELHNYVSTMPDISLFLYDLQTHTRRHLDTIHRSKLNVPADGSMLLYLNNKQKWILRDMETFNRSVIGGMQLDSPYFSPDNRYILFESKSGLWQYDIKKRKLQSLKASEGKIAVIDNMKRMPLENISYTQMYHNFIEGNANPIIKLTDANDLETSYFSWHNGKTQEIIVANKYNIREIVYDTKLFHLCIIEEDFNMPSKLYHIDIQKKTKNLLLDSFSADQSAATLRRDIIKYSSSYGIPLTGTLHYPADYDPHKKYPMVVRIYQVQSPFYNEYRVPGHHNSVGFDRRTLQQKGYFVYLPDIVSSPMGPGMSALDCVNNALDAIADIKNIDFGKVGLMGHSYGSYETNFIATKSDRFAAYVSGAGPSDIVSMYFSYSYNFSSPLYWQFENGQFEMNVPFAEDKQLYFNNNPVYEAEKVCAPILLWAGKKDNNIPPAQIMEFYIALRRNLKPVIALFYKDGGHTLGVNTPEKRDIHHRVLEWFDYFLQGKGNIDWIDRQMKKDKLAG